MLNSVFGVRLSSHSPALQLCLPSCAIKLISRVPAAPLSNAYILKLHIELMLINRCQFGKCQRYTCCYMPLDELRLRACV